MSHFPHDAVQKASRRPTQCDQILARLVEARGEVSSRDLSLIALRYDARIVELRRLGYRIVSRVEHRDGKVYGFFRLDPSSVPAARAAGVANSLRPSLPPANEQQQAALFDTTVRHRDLG